MGYYSKVAVALRKADFADLQKSYDVFCRANAGNPEVTSDLFTDCIKRTASDGRVVLYWSGIKWYDDYPEVKFFMDFIRDLDHMDFLRCGEEPDDIEEIGNSEYGAPFYPEVALIFNGLKEKAA